MDQIITSDLYLAAYCLVRKCRLEAVEGLPVNDRMACRITLSGERIGDIQLEYLDCRANVNLYEFHKAYNQISSFIATAKFELNKQLKERKQHSARKGGQP